MVARQAHNLEDAGPNPAPATMIAMTPVVRFGNKRIVHVIATSTDELNEVALFTGNGIRDAGTDNEHLSITPAQAAAVDEYFDVELLEQDIMFYGKDEP